MRMTKKEKLTIKIFETRQELGAAGCGGSRRGDQRIT